jgi:hypothetical protein
VAAPRLRLFRASWVCRRGRGERMAGVGQGEGRGGAGAGGACERGCERARVWCWLGRVPLGHNCSCVWVTLHYIPERMCLCGVTGT